jgi:filamentous hemagglutinin
MNKNRLRIIFNVTRGLMMVVAEFVKSHMAGAESTNNSQTGIPLTKNKRDISVNLRPLAFSLMCALALVTIVPNQANISLAQAEAKAASNVPGNQRPTVLNAPNSVEVVNIQTPSAAGVSRNVYEILNVPEQGMIFNNSRTNVQTELGGWIQGNPWLATGSARIILNEINSSNPSYLNGYMEVAGSRAELIIANPNGISCNGCGFINASRGILTTGTPILNGGDLTGYRVTGGTVNFWGNGLDASRSNYTDIIARALEVNAGIWANDLKITTGANQVNAANTQVTIIAGSGATPNFALDVSALGGMYAGKITLIGTEAGLGVRNAGVISANAGHLTLDVNGNLTNSNTLAGTTQTNIQANHISNSGGRIISQQQLELNAINLSGDGQILAGGDATVNLIEGYTHTTSGALQANGNLSLNTTGNLLNQSAILAGQALTIHAANIDNTVSGELSGLNTYLDTTGGTGTAIGAVTNRGLIDGGDTFIHTGTLNNFGTGAIFGDHVAIAADTLNNLDETVNGVISAPVIAARNRMDIGAKTINNNSNNTLLFSGGNMAIGGSLDNNWYATGTAMLIHNHGGTIEAQGNLDINAVQTVNGNAGLVTRQVTESVVTIKEVKPEGWSQRYDVSYFPTIYNYGIEAQQFVGDDGTVRYFEDYYYYKYDATTQVTEVVSSQPGQILSGSNMTITGNLTNTDSQIIAGGNLTQSGGTLQNISTEGIRTVSYDGTVQFRDWDGDDEELEFGPKMPFNPATQTTTYHLGIAKLQSNTLPASGNSIDNTAPVVPAIAGSSLFTAQPDSTANYLLETDPRFANYKTWLSSDYMLNAMSYDPATVTKRLGDGFYEQRLIREQIAQLTGRRFLTGYANDETQYQALMNAGISFAQAYQLTPGIALTAAQIAQLTSDIVWLVAQTVTLADGTTQTVLVPQVYLVPQAGDLQATGALIAGQNIHLQLSQDAINQGTIAGRDIVQITADNIHNLHGTLQGNAIVLQAHDDINNQGGIISAQSLLALQAGHDITSQSTTQSSENSQGTSDFSRTNIDRIAGLYVSNPNGLLLADAGNDIHLIASVIQNQGSDSTTQLNAANNIILGTLTIAEDNSSIADSRNYVKDGYTAEIGSSISTGGNITMTAQHDITARAANVSSDNGTLTANAGNNLTLESGTASSYSDAAQYKKESGFLSSKSKQQRDTFNDTNVVSSTFSADSVNLNAQNNITITGSNVVATDNVNLNANNNISITSAQATHDESHFYKEKNSGFTASSTSIGYSSSTLQTTNDTQQVINIGSTVGSVQGDVNINAGKAYTQTASNVLTPGGDINITAQSVDINAATDTYANQQSMEYEQTGITLAISNPVVSAVQTANQMAEAASHTSDPRMQALAAGTTALATYNASNALPDQYGNIPTVGNTGANDMTNVTEANAADQVGGINVSLSIGTSEASSSSSQNVSTANGSTLSTGGDVNITASGAGQDSDINVSGSTITAAHDVTLKADDTINLQAAKNKQTLNSENENSSASIGISVNLGANAGVGITAGISSGNGNADGHDVTWTETRIQGGNNTDDTVTLNSGADTNLIGAQVSGNQVIANVGTRSTSSGQAGSGNLNIQSLQDSSSYDSQQESAGISVTVPITGTNWGGSISSANSNINSNYQSVNEQAGIFAGDEGFQVNTQGNTNLTGAIIASTEQALQNNVNSLTTQTLTTSNIENSAEYEGEGYSVTVGTGKQAGLPQLSGLGVGHDAGDTDSVTLSAISSGTVKVTDEAKQQALSGKAVDETIATLNRDVHVNEQGQAVDSQGNSTANTITPIFDAEIVQNEINAQVQITQAFDKEQQQFRIEINKMVDKEQAKKEAIVNLLGNQDLSEELRSELIIQGLNAQKEIERLENVTIIFSAIAGGLSAPTNSIGGIAANSLAPEVANQIGQYFKDHGTEGTAPHILAHGVLAGAVAVLGGNNPMGAALASMSGEVIAPLVADLLYGKTSEELNAEQKAIVSNIARLGGITAAASVDTNVNNIAQANLSVQNAVDNNWGVVGHYSTMATVLYLAGFSSKDARAIALAAWGPDTDRRNAMSSNSVVGSLGAANNSQTIHLLDSNNDPAEVIATQQDLAAQVGDILQTIKQYENDPAKKAEYLTRSDVQNTLHAFGDAFAHVEEDGTHYPSGTGHATQGTKPDNPNTHPDAYQNYVNTLFNVASQVTVIPRVSNSAITTLVDKVTTVTSESGQATALSNTIGSVSSSTSSSLVNSPVSDCGFAGDCFRKKIGSQVNPQINMIYDIKK